jgi:hypothetical protein
MTRLLWRNSVLGATGAVLLAACFMISVMLWGSWWRVTDMPRAEEWSALFGASALAALGFAWYQIRQVDKSNQALITSNAETRQVNVEAVRPRVQVYLEMERVMRKQRGQAPHSNIFVAVRNVGPSPALDVRLSVNPPFVSLEEFFLPGGMVRHLTEMNDAFSGNVQFPKLHSGNPYIWFIGRTPETIDDESSNPRRWVVTAEYGSSVIPTLFSETFVIDLDVEYRMARPEDPLLRIGKDIEVVGERLDAIRRSIPEELSLDAEALGALTKRTSRAQKAPKTRTRPAAFRR